MTLQFSVKLLNTDPLVWRRIIVPFDYCFYQLHLAIQGAFGWENCHLFQFCEHDILDKNGIGIPNDDVEGLSVMDAKAMKVKNIFKNKGGRYTYIYDYGDNWQHEVTLEKALDEEIISPFCMDGAGMCPPEDVGGINGYKKMLEVFASPFYPEQESYRQWLDMEPDELWNPGYFKVREANKRLALLEG